MGFLDAISSSRTSERVSMRVKYRSALARREALIGYAFIAPWLIGFIAFYFLPMVASLMFSTFDFQLATPEDATFIGLDNWVKMFNDSMVWTSLKVTLGFAALSLPIGIILPIAIAILLNSEYLIGKNIFRTLFYAPSMVPAIAAVLIWSQVLNPQTGWLNRMIEYFTGYEAVGVNGIRWVNDPYFVYFAYILIGLWGISNAILVNLASLQGVPTELYEAAEIDGAGWWRKIRHITLPMISPVIFYNLVLGLVGSMQYFATPYILNDGNGEPAGMTYFYMIYFYKNAFRYADMGYGATLAWFMFIIALAITLVLFGTAKYWVHYNADQS